VLAAEDEGEDVGEGEDCVGGEGGQAGDALEEVVRDGRVRGDELVGDQFQKTEYLWHQLALL
jgi:hypothetical protein